MKLKRSYQDEMRELKEFGFVELCSLSLPSTWFIGIKRVIIPTPKSRTYFLYKNIFKLGFDCNVMDWDDEIDVILVKKGNSYYESN